MSTSSHPSETVLSPAFQADSKVIDVMGVGKVSYYGDVTGEWPAVVLLHSVNAAASALEMRPLFDAFRGRRRVFAPDLPGFGRSERGDRKYTPELYANAIERFIIDVASPQGEPVDAVALSLSSEFLARVAVRAPGLFRSLTLISPTGFDSRRRGGALARAILPRVLRLPGISHGLFALLGSERSVRYFLKKSFVGAVDEGLVRYAVETASMPDARHAPLAFLSGALFTPRADKALYEHLKVPTTVVYDRDPYTRFDRLEAVTRANPDVSFAQLRPSLGMPHFERTAEVVEVIERATSNGGART